MLDRMLLRLFAVPLILLLSAPVALWLLGSYIPSEFAGKFIIDGLGQQAASLALPACWVLVGLATVVAIYQSVRLWLWSSGKTDSCHHCGGMISAREGRYGPYVRCLACGANRSLR
jgi:hypothetical protein